MRERGMWGPVLRDPLVVINDLIDLRNQIDNSEAVLSFNKI
jgi:hypothetical protein